MDKRVAEIVFRKCLGGRAEEPLLIVGDPGTAPLAAEFHRVAAELGLNSSLLVAGVRLGDGEPPEVVEEALHGAAVAALLTSGSLTHTRARREATDRHRVRIASLPGPDSARLAHLLGADLEELAVRGGELARFFEGPRQVRITSAAGTNLAFSTGNRIVHRDVGALREPGAWGHLPCGRISLAPLEGTAAGLLVIDASLPGIGTVAEPVRVRFENGRATEISDPRLAELLRKHGEMALNLAAFGIGLNPRAEIEGHGFEDTLAAGSAYIAFGDNTALGGVVSVPLHVSAVLQQVKVEVDGESIPDRWLRAPRATRSQGRPPASPPDVDRSETYRALFEHSNDGQYVLDMETQRFLEVNPSFEKLSGYTRAELLSGDVKAPDLVARESKTTFQQKRETRRHNPSERYDLRVVCKDGQKKPVELSVRRLALDGREVVLGSVRDLSDHKRLEQEMWEKIQELGFASNRIMALTEKIQKVPEFTPKLLSVTGEQQLLESAAEMLCSRGGLGYTDVSFWLLRGDMLELAYSTLTMTRKRRMKASEESPLGRILLGTEKGVIDRLHAALPLKGRERSMGVLEVSFHPKEIEVLEGNEQALKGYHDLLETMSSIIGLLVENLHLYETVRTQSIVDPLTGVFNRRYFDERLTEEVGRAARYGRSLSLMLIDLDHFKEINDDTEGRHKQGDSVLIETAKVFRAHTREVDWVCRLGGDEFAVIMPETPYEAALQKAEILRREVSEKKYANIVSGELSLRMSLSIGVTTFTEDVRSPDDLVKVGDEALYSAKRSGRDTVCGTMPRKPRDGAQKDRTATRRFQPPK